MRKALILVFITAVAVSSSCSRSYYHDAGVLSAYQRQARAMCLAADAKSKLSTCRRAKACAEPAQRGLEAILAYEQASATMTATIDERVAADAAYQNARENTPHTARMAHDQALAKIMQHLLKDDTQVYKQFVENESFKRFVGDMVYSITNP